MQANDTLSIVETMEVDGLQLRKTSLGDWEYLCEGMGGDPDTWCPAMDVLGPLSGSGIETVLNALSDARAQNCYAAVAAIQYALENDEGLEFLRRWNQGDFDVLRREWPDVPDEVFIGADPLFVPAKA